MQQNAQIYLIFYNMYIVYAIYFYACSTTCYYGQFLLMAISIVPVLRLQIHIRLHMYAHLPSVIQLQICSSSRAHYYFFSNKLHGANLTCCSRSFVRMLNHACQLLNLNLNMNLSVSFSLYVKGLFLQYVLVSSINASAQVFWAFENAL